MTNELRLSRREKKKVFSSFLSLSLLPFPPSSSFSFILSRFVAHWFISISCSCFPFFSIGLSTDWVLLVLHQLDTIFSCPRHTFDTIFLTMKIDDYYQLILCSLFQMMRKFKGICYVWHHIYLLSWSFK